MTGRHHWTSSSSKRSSKSTKTNQNEALLGTGQASEELLQNEFADSWKGRERGKLSNLVKDSPRESALASWRGQMGLWGTTLPQCILNHSLV